MRITWLGTASIAIITRRTSILFDPFIPLAGSSTDTTAADFLPVENIFITHGHLDHIGGIETYAKGKKIHCTMTPAITLLDKGVPRESISIISPGDTVTIGDIRITAYKGRHITFDKKLILSTGLHPRMVKYRSNLNHLRKESAICKENGETLCYMVEADGKRIFLLGSLGIADSEIYPRDVDLLVLPYQGNSDLLKAAYKVIARINPSAIFLDHFDDTFPPISKYVDTSDIREAFMGVLPITAPIHKHIYDV